MDAPLPPGSAPAAPARTATGPNLVRRRLAVHLGGYDLQPPDSARRRFDREIRRFERCWSAEAAVSTPTVTADTVTWTVATRGEGWRVATDVVWLRWDDVIAAGAARPWPVRLAAGLAACPDFVAGGALLGYARLAWRYALFFLFPFLLLAAFAALGALAGAAVARAIGSVLAGTAAGAGLALGLLRWPGRRFYLFHLLDDWAFARRIVRQPDPILGPRLDRLGAALAKAAGAGTHDEIVVVGHSLGAVLAVELVAAALARDPRLGTGATRFALLSVGSSLLKVGLHRRSARLRAALVAVGNAPGIAWAEYQALIDIMNFYKTDPLAALRLRAARHPAIRVVRISRMLARGYYMRMKVSFFRVHNQFVSGNDLRAPYDYFMHLCGPLPAETLVASRDGPVSFFGPDGALRASPADSAREVSA